MKPECYNKHGKFVDKMLKRVVGLIPHFSKISTLFWSGKKLVIHACQ